MKKISFIFLLFFLISAISFAQQPDSVKSEKDSKSDRQKAEKEFVDNNGNGIDDREELSQKNKETRGERRRDYFIDTNGDGICDGREDDLMGRGQTRNRKQKGRK